MSSSLTKSELAAGASHAAEGIHGVAVAVRILFHATGWPVERLDHHPSGARVWAVAVDKTPDGFVRFRPHGEREVVVASFGYWFTLPLTSSGGCACEQCRGAGGERAILLRSGGIAVG